MLKLNLLQKAKGNSLKLAIKISKVLCAQ